MKSKSSKNTNFYRSAFLPVILTMLSLTAFTQTTQLSLVDIFTALRSKKATLIEKNDLLTQGVIERGITFVMSKSLEDELRNAGADDKLIEVIRKRNPAPPQPKPTPKAVATPLPQDHSYFQNRGNSNFVLGEFDSAISDYTRSLELKPDEPTVYLSRGIAFQNSKNFELAIKDFSRVIELEPQESMAYYNRGNALEKTGEKEKAISDYQKAFEIDPENDLAEKAVQRLQASSPKPLPAPQDNGAVRTPSSPTDTEQTVALVNPDEPVFIDSLQSLAVSLTNPKYPPFGQTRSVGGLVTVQVIIDEKGRVTSAKASNGPKLLHRISEEAARRSKFKPYLINNTAVKVTGLITYNFNSN